MDAEAVVHAPRPRAGPHDRAYDVTPDDKRFSLILVASAGDDVADGIA